MDTIIFDYKKQSDSTVAYHHHEFTGSGKGSLSILGNFNVRGKFCGNLTLTGTLTVDDESNFVGKIQTENLVLHGKMAGNAVINNTITFHKNSSFSGNLIAKKAYISKDCIINGTYIIDEMILLNEIETSNNKTFPIR